MKKTGSIFILAVALLMANQVSAQDDHVIRMDATTNGTIYDLDGGSITIRDDDSQGAGAPNTGSYQYGQDYTLTILGNCPAPSRILFRLDEVSIDCLDTLYLYDGMNTSGNLIAKINSFTNNVSQGGVIFETPANTTGYVTFRFRTDPRTDTNRTRLSCHQQGGMSTGFAIYVTCGIPCETVVPVIEDEFYRTRNGEIYDTSYVRLVTVYDTIYNVEDDTTSGIAEVDTNQFYGAHLCIGDGVIFKGHGNYTYNYGYYTPSDATSYFRWDMANEGDTIVGVGQTMIEYSHYQRTGCFDMRLDITDAYGCSNSVYTSIKIRTALNPIKTIYTLADICNNDSLMVNMGYGGENATLTLRKIETEDAISKTYDVRTFVPDGCNCATPSYFEAPVEFTEFPNSRTVTSSKDICSICINMEHSFLGDIYISIVCPTGAESLLKFGTPSQCNPAAAPGQPPIPTTHEGDVGRTGGGIYLGYPLDSSPWDAEPKCDSTYNPYGIGLDYCFSRDTHYTLVTGDNAAGIWTSANPYPAGDFYIGCSAYATTVQSEPFPTIPAPFSQQGQIPGNASGSIKNPSNHEEKLDYYLPYATFDELIGCPLNGTWKIRVYDTYGIDNGWIFNWSLDICNVMPDDCRYQVGVDSLVWYPDPSPQYNDYDLGHYRGAVVHKNTPTVSHILSPDTAGTFPILVRVYDEFGCEWDTTTRITSFWSPTPDLGPDSMLCGDTRMLLDGTDRHTADQNYSYLWAPFGQNTDTIMTLEDATDTINYIVEVKNKQRASTCVGRDTITIAIGRQPMPNFIPEPFVFEGCAPFTLSFNNQTTNAVEHLWVFGDGITSSLPSPTHTYDAGLYDLRYYATSADGCVDSIVSPQSIAVYNAPKAAFSWAPTYPSVTNPVAHFTNLTEPKTPQTKYFWELQYNIENPLSVETLVEENPSFDFSRYVEGDPSGNYAVRLIARTDNLAPSGNMIYCRDTTENAILVVNDFLQFPNVVSPNGDGVNDRFVIKNLVEGMGYPINQLDIYNKWGARVYHKENISRDEDFWDPQDMPAGTYFYRFSARGYNGNVEHNGAIEVVK